jgi:D-alanine-D-alanine ligase-like ATP-grasp enzyme
MKIAVVFDWMEPGWEDADFKKELTSDAAEAEYEIAEALIENGHDVFLIGFHDNLPRLLNLLEEFDPDLVFNSCESFMGKPRYDYAVTALLEMKGYRYTGSPPEALLLARDKATKRFFWPATKPQARRSYPTMRSGCRASKPTVSDRKSSLRLTSASRSS